MSLDGLTGVQKAAVLLITLGPERSAEIFKHLKDEEIEELTLEIANTRSVSPEVKEEVLSEFYQVCLAQQYIAEGGIGYAKQLLDKALGNERAQEVITKLTASIHQNNVHIFNESIVTNLIIGYIILHIFNATIITHNNIVKGSMIQACMFLHTTS